MSGARRILAQVLLAGVFVMDGYDLNAMPLAVPHLETSLGMSPALFGVVFSAVLVGMGAGSAIFAPLGDRFGRKPMIVFGCVLAAVSTLGTATAGSITAFAFWRFLTGLSLGATLPNCTALSAELAPAGRKAFVMALVSAGITLGAMGAGLTAPEVVRMGGWEGLFVIPGLFAAALAVALGFVLGGNVAATEAVPEKAAKVPQLQLFKHPWTFPFAVFAVALTLNAVNLYLLSNWIPTILPRAGYTIDAAARISGLMQGAGFVMGLAMSFLIDRWRPGWVMVGTYLMMAAALLAIGLGVVAPEDWTPFILLAMGGVTGAAMALPALAAFLMPSHLLSSALGVGVLVARAGAIAGPMIGQFLLTTGAEPREFLLAAAGPAILGALVCLALPAALRVKPKVEAAVA
ncbi:MFS transporter [Altererythrobacter salegens]|uniref:MFS transporter n=1 Tax=Croceibacterium salegens TaxID=1737568 RepID=A0A6I4STZ6_9SPHN|nr:MFS transporter [Croceibacterium salegens]MXO58979.1 MFS transporter [Croceibacterium salegens]